MEKRLTDNEIIKAFKMHLLDNRDCELCPYGPAYYRCDIILLKDVIDLINRLQTENKRLEKEVNLVSIQFQDLQERYEESQMEIERLNKVCQANQQLINALNKSYFLAKAEAYKECIEKVKNYIKTHCNPYGKPDFDYNTSIKILNFIDNLKKELVGEDNVY